MTTATPEWLGILDDLELVVSRRLAKQETAASRSDRDALQRRRLQLWVDALRRYYVGLAERIGVDIDTTLAPNQRRAGRMVNPEIDRRTKVILKRKTFVGLPTRAPFDLPIDWQAEENVLADLMGQEYTKWLSAGTNQSLIDIQRINADVDAIRGLSGTLQLGDYDRSIRAELANRVVRINEVQRTVLRDTVQRGIEAGLSTKEIANGARVGGRVYPGIKGRVEEFYRNRSRVIALTESANAYNLGQLEGYSRSGVIEEVRIFDGLDCGWTSHEDPDKANGTTRTIAQARAHPTSHPNCQRSWAPVPLKTTQGVGRTADKTTGNPSTTTPASTAPKPSQPTPRTSADVGRSGSRLAEADFDEVIQHVMPEGYTYDPLDGTVIKPNGFLDSSRNIGLDATSKKRLAEVYKDRYGVDAKFARTNDPRIYNIGDQIDAMRAFEDYRELGIGFDDLTLVFDGSGTKAMQAKIAGGGVKWAHYDNIAGTTFSGEVRVFPTLTRSIDDIRIRGLPDRNISSGFHGTDTSFRGTLRHELGHAFDARTMGGASRGVRYRRALVDADLHTEWDAIHELGTSTTFRSGDIAGLKTASRKMGKLIRELDDDIDRYKLVVDTGQDVNGTTADLLTRAQRRRLLYSKQKKHIDDLVSGKEVEPLPTRYAKQGGVAEDIAESFDMYLDNPAYFRQQFPIRADLIERALARGRTLPRAYADDVPKPKALADLEDAAREKAARAAAKRKEAAARRKRLAEEKKRREAEERARREAEERARIEAERRAAEEARRRAAAQDSYRPLDAKGADDVRLRGDSDLMRTRIAEAKLEHGEYSGDPIHAAINAITGADRAAKVVDSVDDLVRQGWGEMFRSVNGTEYLAQFRKGSLFPGRGIYGNGTYATLTGSSRHAAFVGSRDYGSAVMRMAIDPRAKAITHDNAYKAWRTAKADLERRLSVAEFDRLKRAGEIGDEFASYDDLARLTQDAYAKTADLDKLGTIRKRVRVQLENNYPVYDDMGRWATAEGYDVILVEGGNFSQPGFTDYVVILNRSAVAVERNDFVGSIVQGSAADTPLGTPALRVGNV